MMEIRKLATSETIEVIQDLKLLFNVIQRLF